MPAQIHGEDICTSCRQSPLDVSLVLTCNHRLCLDCAARELQSDAAGDHSATCPSCGALTEVDPAAAEHLREHRAAAVDRGPTASHIQQRFGGGASSSSSTPRHAPPEDRCGQCETERAEVDCLQCGEQFCSRCASAIHRAGRMREHRIVPLAGSATLPTSGPSQVAQYQKASAAFPPVAFPPAPGRTASDAERQSAASTALAPSGARCPHHPDESAMFYCMDGDSECICAECAVEAAHAGREVMNVRKAYQTLSGHMDRTLDGLRQRAEEHAGTMKQAQSLKAELDMIISKGKKNIQEAFRQVRLDLQQKEAELLAGVDVCESCASQSLVAQVQPATTHTSALQEAQMALRKIDARSDEVKALNMFAAAKATLEHLVDPQTGVDGQSVGQLLDRLRHELRGALQQQASDVNSLASHVGDIRRSGASPGANQSVLSPIGQ